MGKLFYDKQSMLLKSYLTIASVDQQYDQQHDYLLASNNAEQLYRCRQSSRNHDPNSHAIYIINRVCSWRVILLSYSLTNNIIIY